MLSTYSNGHHAGQVVYVNLDAAVDLTPKGADRFSLQHSEVNA